MASSSDEAFALIESMGLTPLYQEVAPFSLPMLSSPDKEMALSHFKGQWTLLAFWATWCGPCQEELPLLEQLAQQYKGRLHILGVNVDQGASAAMISSFVQKKGITFPQFLDGEGKASAIYRAQAIPTIYLISPNQKIVGLVQGAMDWGASSVTASLEKLLNIKEVTGVSSQKKVGTLSEPEVQIKLEPPLLEWGVPQKNLFTHAPFTVELFVRWKGDSRRYMLRSPTLTLPVGIKQLSLSSEMRQEQLVYVIELEALQAGEALLGPLTLPFSPRGGQGEQSVRLPPLKIKVEEKGSSISWMRWPFLFLPLIILLLFFTRRKRFQKRVQEKAKVNLYDLYQDDLALLRQEKLHLSTKEYSQKLFHLYEKVMTGLALLTEEEKSTLQKRRESLNYGGASLTSEEIQSLEKKLEKNCRRPDNL